MKRFFKRHQPVPVLRVISISGLGAFLAVLLMGAITSYGSLPLMIAPFGASCVLLFASHTSSWSQPINVVGGHFVSALVGLALASVWPSSIVVAAAAVAFALMAMMVLRVAHPPAGAIAFVAYSANVSWMFLLFPVLAGSVVLVGLAFVYHAVTEAQYPLHLPK